MADADIHGHITDLVAQEKDLRRRLSAGEISRDEERQQLRDVETELDRYWDLLRQRDAQREFSGDPQTAALRDGETVEHYLE